MNPFTETLERLWELLESHEGFAALVRPGNRRKLSGPSSSAARAGRLPSDLPEVVIEPAGGEIEMPATSTSARAVQRYAIRVTAGGDRPAETLLLLKWELVRALARAGEGLGLSYVRNVRVGSAAERAGIEGGSAALVLTVEMWFSRSELEA